LPVVDAVQPDYANDVRFIAVAGQAGFDATKEVADELLANTEWGLDDAIWDLYGVRGQPVSFLITGSDVVVGNWFGAAGEEDLRKALDELVALGA
ncbi:MAG: hypothetical protein M3094_08365, partial [Actinomycetia bacterium]|nr:hypothetical protein [Actinomycetes bacterium]